MGGGGRLKLDSSLKMLLKLDSIGLEPYLSSNSTALQWFRASTTGSDGEKQWTALKSKQDGLKTKQNKRNRESTEIIIRNLEYKQNKRKPNKLVG